MSNLIFGKFNSEMDFDKITELRKLLSRIEPTHIYYTPNMVIGSTGSGKCHHPWDNLKPCICGCKERPLLFNIYGELYSLGESKEALYVACQRCERRTVEADISTVIEKWNKEEFL